MAISFIKKIVFSALLLAGCSFAADAAKPNVYIDYFRAPNGINTTWVECVRNNVIEGIHNLNRVNLIDVDSNEALRIEDERRHQDNIQAGEDIERMAVMKQEGANYIINGRVSSIDVVKNTRDDGGIYYTAQINLTLKVINPNDGKLAGTATFNLGGDLLDLTTGSTPDEVVLKVAGKAKNKIRKFIEETFKLEGTVLEISKVDKDKAKMLYISIGDADGVAKDAEFEVCISRIIGNRKTNSVIGLVKVKDVEGDDISLCEVKKGDKEILAAFNAGQTLTIKSKAKSGRNPIF